MTFSQRQNHSRVYILLPQKHRKSDLLKKLSLFHFCSKCQITVYHAIDNRHKYVGQSDCRIRDSMSVRFYLQVVQKMYKLICFIFNLIFFLSQNDIIGPPGYGEARFISLTTPLNYKIRFENEANATAPAQHVIILHTLDQDLDMRTFRVTSFGFGNFTRKLTNARASIQVNVSGDQ